MKKESVYLIKHRFNNGHYGSIVEYKCLDMTDKHIKLKKVDMDFVFANGIIWIHKDSIDFFEDKDYWIVDEVKTEK
jgi:hypothetical protein